MARPKTNRFLSLSISNRWLIAGIVVALILGGGGVYALYSKNKKEVSTIPSTTASQNESPSASDQDNTGTGADATAGSSQPETASDKQSTGGSTTTLTPPSGQFVSNHFPSLSDNDRKKEVSVCNTTPGATCYIKFTKGGTTKQLSAQTADNNGTASWQWDVQTAGLSQGSWVITAVATLGNQSQSAQDAQNLEVQP
jgi:hypothetical protein